MADPVLKFPPEQKGNPASPTPRPKPAAEPRRRLMAGLRRYRRFLLLVVLPLVALVAGVTFYLNGGRYVTTDDAYVGAQKVLITPDISGKIEKVVVKEGQQVREGDVLFEIDPVPFRLAVAQAKANLAQAKVTYDNLAADLRIYGQMSELSQQGMDLKRRDVDRKSSLVKNNFGSQLDLDNASTALVTAAPSSSCCSRRSRPPRRNCSAIRTSRSRSFRPMPRPRQHSTRRSAISTTPRCAHRWRALPRRSNRFSSAAS